ncbi:MAG: radical SAM protein [Pirellulales bacterium]|nr:radical SAM protein [Pirellulales bacterium]
MTLREDTPLQELSALDDLWFQVSGTLCNLTCHHCFISCSPKNDKFGYLSLVEVKQRLEESVALGVKEYYFTGGEPFLNRDMVPILVETLRYGPATVLTNGTVLKDDWLDVLSRAEDESRYSLEFRVSIDGFSAESNDPIRGEGTFDRALAGVVKLVEHGFLPIITATRTWPDEDDSEVLGGFTELLRSVGYHRPRIKLLPSLKIGAEVERTCGYDDSERLTAELYDGFDSTQLVCEHSRVVTDAGVYVCPILIDEPDARMSDTLSDSLGSFRLSHGACFTCYQYGSICSNPSSGAGRAVGTEQILAEPSE